MAGMVQKFLEYYHQQYLLIRKLIQEPNHSLSKHNVLLGNGRKIKLFLLGFEDVRRDEYPFKCDQDSMMAIIFVSSNASESISTCKRSPVDKPELWMRDWRWHQMTPRRIPR